VLPTFVIGLREGLEAALIVGMIAAFLRKQGRSDLLRQLVLGVALAITVCLLGGVALEAASRDLPQRQQEGLETVIGIIAVAMVTYMVIWMKEHSRGLKSELESMAASAIDGSSSRSGTAMVVMAGLAVFREGFETVVFLLAAFHESGSGGSAAVGAILGIALAVLLGYGIYRGGVRINLSKFFRATGLVLVLVAGGLVVSAIHTAHEAGWLTSGQYQMFDLSWLVRPGSVLSSLLTGMLGIQPYPVLAEVLGWLLYVVPIGIFVAWPPGRAMPPKLLRSSLSAVAVAGIGTSAVLTALLPSVGSASPITKAGSLGVRVAEHQGNDIVVRIKNGTTADYRLRHTASTTIAGQPAETYTAQFTSPGTGPATISPAALAAVNGGRLPLGVQTAGGELAARYSNVGTVTVSIDQATDTVLTMQSTQDRFVLATGSSGQSIESSDPIDSAETTLPTSASDRAAAAVRRDHAEQASRDHRQALAVLFGVLGAAALLGLGSFSLRRQAPSAQSVDPARSFAVS
jgi:high-affinity iron transporter